MNLGVYIHIPFCETKCNYCHFVTRPMHGEIAERYCRAVVRELQAFSRDRKRLDIADTIYFGGGTPSVVPGEHIERILETCRTVFAVPGECEITLETNPGSLTEAKIDLYRKIGVNRVSLGAQSFDDEELISIGRDHTGKDIDRTVRLLRSGGIENLNLDLMLGLPGQDSVRWSTDLERLARLLPDHVSVYMLDVHERSPLYHSMAKGRLELPDEDLVADLYLITLERLSALGYEQYEISNFARAGRRSAHNLKYWKREPVLGFGVGSHSYDGVERYANLSKVSDYLQSVEMSGAAVEWRQPLGASQGLQETLFLGLRLNEGLDWSHVRNEFGDLQTASYEATLREMSGRGLLEWKESSVRLTSQGMLLSNEIFSEFV
jgi:oxygen-independent coproporphyrinogen III oxidase